MVNGSSQNQDGNKTPTVPIGSAGPDKVYCGALWQKRNSQLLHLERVEKSKVARVPKARSRECIWRKKRPPRFVVICQATKVCWIESFCAATAASTALWTEMRFTRTFLENHHGIADVKFEIIYQSWVVFYWPRPI